MRWNAVSYSCHSGLFAAASFVDLFSGGSKTYCASDCDLIYRRSPQNGTRLLLLEICAEFNATLTGHRAQIRLIKK
jgi:hypothetical protein